MFAVRAVVSVVPMFAVPLLLLDVAEAVFAFVVVLFRRALTELQWLAINTATCEMTSIDQLLQH